MDSIKTLMDKQEYELVIQLTEKSTDIDSIFYRISALLGIGKGEEALATLKKHHNTLKKNLCLLIKVHLDLLIILGKFDEAYDELEYYKNLPYESQQVEELLAASAKHIRDEERMQNKSFNLTDDEIKSRLKSNDEYLFLSGFDAVSKRGSSAFLNEIKYVLVNNPHQKFRSLALMLLVKEKYDKPVDVKNQNGLVNVIPSKVKPPFVGEPFEGLVKKIRLEFRDPSLSEGAINILSTYIIETYPEEYDEDERYTIATLHFLATVMVQGNQTLDDKTYCMEHNLELNTFNNLKDRFLKALQNN